MPFIITIANEKGGVAKTTTTLSLGAALVEMGKNVLLIDLDPQANLTLAAGIEPGEVRRSIANVFLESKSINSVARKTAIAGLDIVPSNSEMGLAEQFIPIRQNYESLLRRMIRDKANLDYHYIFLDCPPFLGAVTCNALMAADSLLMPTQPEYFSIHALGNMMSLVRKVRAQGNPLLTYHLLITMMDRRNRIHRTLSEQLRTTFTSGVLETVIPTDTKLRECAIAGMPIIYYAPFCRAAEAYRTLAQEINQYAQETAEQPA